MESIDMKKVWEVEMEICDAFDKICNENHLKYSLSFGTLLGAIRHKGFIPWDDDIDVVMPYEDYKKLLEIWNDVAPKNYILQNKEIENEISQNFSKIVKDHTTFIQFENEKEKKYQKGIFIDVFPAYRVAPGKISRRLQYIACAINLLYSRGYTSGSKGIIGYLEKVLLILPKSIQENLRKSSDRFMSKWNDEENLDYFVPCTFDSLNKFYPYDTFDNIKKVNFEDREYMATSAYDKFLTICFGNYMQLPPEEERTWAHHPLLIDFNHNYEEIK